jgi:hypothetical protein
MVVPEKIHTPPTKEISAVRREDKIVSDNSKCIIRTSEGGRGVNFQWVVAEKIRLALFSIQQTALSIL